MSPLDTSRLRAEAVRIALANRGYGRANPHFLAAIGSPPKANYCAIFAAYCYRRAYEECKLTPGGWLYRRKHIPEPGAKRLVRNLGAVGSIWKPSECDASRPVPGDLVAWHRGVLGWTGHVGIVVELHKEGFLTVEGNVGGRVVERFHTWQSPKLYRFASIER